MMNQDKIQEKIYNGMNNCAENYNIDSANVRIRLVDCRDLKLYLYNGISPVKVDDVAVKLDLANTFSLNMMERVLVKGFLQSNLNTLARKNNIEPEQVSAMIIKKNDGLAVLLLNGNNTVKELLIKEFLN